MSRPPQSPNERLTNSAYSEKHNVLRSRVRSDRLGRNPAPDEETPVVVDDIYDCPVATFRKRNLSSGLESNARHEKRIFTGLHIGNNLVFEQYVPQSDQKGTLQSSRNMDERLDIPDLWARANSSKIAHSAILQGPAGEPEGGPMLEIKQGSKQRSTRGQDLVSPRQKNIASENAMEESFKTWLPNEHNKNFGDEFASKLLPEAHAKMFTEWDANSRTNENVQQPPNQQVSNQEFKKKASEFHRFMELPAEIRLMVWKGFLGEQVPRTVVMYCETTAQETPNFERIEQDKDPPANTLEEFYNVSQAEPPPGWPWRLKTAKCPIPAMLHATKESRGVAKKCYRLKFRHQLGGKPVWFDYDKDWLLMDSGAAFDLFMCGIRDSPKDRYKRTKVKSKLQRLALGNLSPTDVVEMCDNIPTFTTLQSLHLEKSFLECVQWEDYFFTRVEIEIKARNSRLSIAVCSPAFFDRSLPFTEVDGEEEDSWKLPRKEKESSPLSDEIRQFRQLAKTAFLDAIRMANARRTLTLNFKPSRQSSL